MLLLGISCIFRGLTVLHDPESQFSAQQIVFVDLPVAWRVTGWVGTGIIAIGGAVWAKPHNEWLGWVALAVMPVERVFGYVFAFVIWIIPGGNPGSPYGIAYAGVWGIALTLLAVMATIKEDSPIRLQITRDEE